MPISRLRADALLGVVGPALGDVLAGEVHDGVAAFERAGRGGPGGRVPRDGGHAEGLRARRVAREDGDVVAAVAQSLDEAPADEAARPR